MVEITIAILGVIGTVFSSIIAYRKSKELSKLAIKHEKEMEKIKSEHLIELSKLASEHEKEMEKMKSKHLIELQNQLNEHDRQMQEIKHNHDMEKLKFESNLNTNSSQGMNDVLNLMKKFGMNPEDIINNPGKINNQIQNINNLAYLNKK